MYTRLEELRKEIQEVFDNVYRVHTCIRECDGGRQLEMYRLIKIYCLIWDF
jgi:hypothetical protein